MTHVLRLFHKSVAWAGLMAMGTIVNAAAGGTVNQIKIQPDKAPDCTSLKSIVQSVTRNCKTNDAKAVAIYNFCELSHYHRAFPEEPGGIPVLKEINTYGWSLCGCLHSEQSALWRELGWGWRFVGWSGHTTVEAQYDNKWHYLDVFLKFYAWEPDGKGGFTIASEDDLTSKSNELISKNFELSKDRGAVYATNNTPEQNWRAPAFLSCGDKIEDVIKGLKTHKAAGSPEGWNGVNHATGSYSTDVNLGPGMALENGWDPVTGAWFWITGKVDEKGPAHTCGKHKDTINDVGYGAVLEPYVDAGPARSYGDGFLTYTGDFSSAAALDAFASKENVTIANKALTPKGSASVVLKFASPYIMTKGSADLVGAEAVQVSTDDGKSFTDVTADDFSAAIKGKLAALVKVKFSKPVTKLNVKITVQNNPGSLPYLSPGKNRVDVTVADAKALGSDQLVVTYAYRLGARSKSLEEMAKGKAHLSNQENAKWDSAITYAQKVFNAKDLPGKFEIDCPTPKGKFPVYPRMIFVRREVIAPGASPLPLPTGAVAAKPAGADEQLVEVPDPFTTGGSPTAEHVAAK